MKTKQTEYEHVLSEIQHTVVYIYIYILRVGDYM